MSKCIIVVKNWGMFLVQWYLMDNSKPSISLSVIIPTCHMHSTHHYRAGFQVTPDNAHTMAKMLTSYI